MVQGCAGECPRSEPSPAGRAMADPFGPINERGRFLDFLSRTSNLSIGTRVPSLNRIYAEKTGMGIPSRRRCPHRPQPGLAAVLVLPIAGFGAFGPNPAVV